jgi:hypothetical protein
VSVGHAKERVTDLPQVAPALFVFAALGDLAPQVKGVDEGVKVGPVIADLRQGDLLPLQNGVQELLPNGLGGGAVNPVHVIPEMLRGQLRRRSFGPNPWQGGLRNPIPHGLFADRLAGPIDGGQANVVAGAQALGPLRA